MWMNTILIRFDMFGETYYMEVLSLEEVPCGLNILLILNKVYLSQALEDVFESQSDILQLNNLTLSNNFFLVTWNTEIIIF